MTNVTSHLPRWVSDYSEVYAFDSLEAFLADKEAGVIYPTLRLNPKGNPGYDGFAFIHIHDPKMKFYHMGQEPRIDVSLKHTLVLTPHTNQPKSLEERTKLDAVKLLYHGESQKVWLINYEQENEQFTEQASSPASLLQQAALRYS